MQSSIITTKGQVVIPKGLRDKYKLKPGTRLFFEETAAGIILKQVDAAFIKGSKGMIVRQKGEKPMKEWWPGFKLRELEREEKNFGLLAEPTAAYAKAVKIKRKK